MLSHAFESIGHSHLTRRRLLRGSAAAGLATVTGAGTLSGCAAAAPFVPAVVGWVGRFATAIAATAIGDFVARRLEEAWQDWRDGAVEANAEQQDAGWVWHTEAYGPTGPDGQPFIFFCVSTRDSGPDGDPKTDRLVTCVQKGADWIYFEPWAWQALFTYVHELTDGREGQQLALNQRTCRRGLLPASVPELWQTTHGSVVTVNYRALDGDVEISGQVLGNGDRFVIVKAYGIPDEGGRTPSVREVTLPAAQF